MDKNKIGGGEKELGEMKPEGGKKKVGKKEESRSFAEGK